jgi:hypothetical protein
MTDKDKVILALSRNELSYNGAIRTNSIRMIPSNLFEDLSPYLMLLRRIIRRKLPKPTILLEAKEGSRSPSPLTFVMIVSPEFDQRIPNAAVMARLGWCHGFQEMGFSYRIVSIFDLAKTLPTLQRPICWLSEADYRYLTRRNLTILKQYRHFVWINAWFRSEEKFYQEHNLPNLASLHWVRKRVLSSEPSFVFTISPYQGIEFYEQWEKQGVKLLSLPLAWDSLVYPENPPYVPEFEMIRIAFVGGYWKYKAKQLDRYLAPYSNILTVYGYSRWPYGQYGGLLPISREGSLYRQARVSPVINEPHVEVMGIDQNERVFKVLGSGGFAVTDAVPGYREWFSDEELLVPKNEKEFHEIIRVAFEDLDFNLRYRKAGQRAVKERHLYQHRAAQVLRTLNLAQVEEMP